MDDRERIAKLEATVEGHRAQFDRIDQALARLQEHIDLGMRDLRDFMQREFRELRDDMREHRESTDDKFAEMRREMTRMTRWMVGLTVTYGIAFVGILAKIVWGA